MAEADMDIDTSRPLALDGQADDYLIDWEEDIQNDNSVINTKVAAGDSHTHADTGTSADADESKPDNQMLHGDDHDDFDLEQDGNTSVAQNSEGSRDALGPLGDPDMAEPELSVFPSEANGTADAVGDEASAYGQDVEEVDAVIEQSTVELGEENSGDLGSIGEQADESAYRERPEDFEVQEDLTEQVQSKSPGDPDQAPQNDQADVRLEADDVEDEITWEEEGEEDEAKEEAQEQGKLEVGGAATEDDKADIEQTPKLSGEEVANDGHHADVEGDASHTNNTTVDSIGDGEGVDADEAVATYSEQATDDGWAESQTITVHYKGEEFPLFSTTSEGFFTETSIFDDTIHGLLAGFRAELADEIAEDEDLVFQVDELGLEYCESDPHESLCVCTLRQILDIFDMLVKNQDPNGTRDLYTYLFTKPSSTKRWEMLLETAASGQGLDAVTKLPEALVPSASAQEGLDGSGNEDELLDEYESIDDGHGEALQQSTGSAQDENGANVSNDADAPAEDEEDIIGEALNETKVDDQDEDEEKKLSNEVMPQETERDVLDADLFDTQSAVNESDSKPPAETGIDYEEQVDFDIVNAPVTTGESYDDQGVPEEIHGGTSTTSTVNAEELDDHQETALENTTQANNETPAAPDQSLDLDEIDWDETEEAVDRTHATTTTGSTKRSHPTDEVVNLDDKTDVKRRRSK